MYNICDNKDLIENNTYGLCEIVLLFLKHVKINFNGTDFYNTLWIHKRVILGKVLYLLFDT